MSVRDLARKEFSRRRAANGRYSIRAYAHFLGLSHAVVRLVLEGKARVTTPTIERLCGRLGLTREQMEHASRLESERRILEFVRSSGFRAEVRLIAVATGLRLDDVNRSLFELLRTRRLHMESAGTWRVTDRADSS